MEQYSVDPLGDLCHVRGVLAGILLRFARETPAVWVTDPAAAGQLPLPRRARAPARTTFCPPKPNELQTAGSMPRPRRRDNVEGDIRIKDRLWAHHLAGVFTRLRRVFSPGVPGIEALDPLFH